MKQQQIVKVTPDESRQLQAERRRAGRDLAELGLSTGRLDPMAVRFLGGSLYVTGRDRDKCLLASVRFPDWPEPFTRYVRHLRIVGAGTRATRSVAYAIRYLTD